ncbi:MAG: hypothetical protein EPN82_00260 [Bacteroidetes bacterium]|nr:MAG: hypothetical protein EPN82_00260 [Bacteroidota bacterium]
MKKVISWIIAIVAAIIVFSLLSQLIWGMIKIAFELGFIIIALICVFIIALPIYMIVSRRFLR